MGSAERGSHNADGHAGEENRKINCFTCSHFFITYDPHEPYGCRAMGFKSRQFPSDVTATSSGMKCQMYAPKRKRRRGYP